MENDDSTPLLAILKALGDKSRLALFRILCSGETTVGELAAKIKLKEPTVSHHLTRLREAGLVTLRTSGTQRFYRVNSSGVDTLKTLIQGIDQVAIPPQTKKANDDQWIAALGWSEEDQKVLRKHTQDGRLKEIPVKQKKILVVLRWLATRFQPDQAYTENEVNTILKSIYESDYVSLRRYLIAFGFLRRETAGGKYWLDREVSVKQD